MKPLKTMPGHRFEYVISDADRWTREPEPTHTVYVRQAADGHPHSASTEWDYAVRVLPGGLLQVDGDMEHDPTYRPLFFTLADFETPTDTIPEVCAVLDRFGMVDATDRETPDSTTTPGSHDADQPAPHVVTVVATLDLGDVSPATVEAEIRATLARLGARLVPCGWAPDPDTIADCTGADRVDVLDLNPNRI